MLRKIFALLVFFILFSTVYTFLLGQKREITYDNYCNSEAWCTYYTTAVKQDDCLEGDYSENWPEAPYCNGNDIVRSWWIECEGSMSGYYYNSGQCPVGWNAIVDVDYW